MNVNIHRVSPIEVADILGEVAFTEERINRHLCATTFIEAGFVDGECIAIWGLIPPTLLSDQAYIWVYTTDAMKGHEFLFIRQSQCMVENMLKSFPIIVGITEIDQPRSIRWLKWLGAEYGIPEGNYIPFVIRRK